MKVNRSNLCVLVVCLNFRSKIIQNMTTAALESLANNSVNDA